jgi:cation diffusion facilitator family transporter
MENKISEQLGYKATLVSALSDVGLAAVKFIAGIFGNSSALVADALHSVSDLATDFISYISIKVSHKEPDAEHPYGHGLAETIGTAVIGLFVAAVGITVVWQEQKHFSFSFPPVAQHDPTWLALAGAVISLVVKEALFIYTLRLGKKSNSESVIANAWHHRSDSLSSLAAAIGIVGSMMGYRQMDPLAAIVVGLLILHMGSKITWEAGQDLMERGLSEERLKEIQRIISSIPGVIQYHEIKTRKAGRDIFIDAHIQVNPRLSVSESHNIAEAVRFAIKKSDQSITDVMIHIDAEDDREGRYYRDRREQVEVLINDALSRFPGVSLADRPVLHYSLRQAAAEISIESDPGVSAETVENASKAIVERLAKGNILTEVVVRQNLAKWNVEKFHDL